MRIVRSTPAVARTDGRYLFQSCVSASDGGHAGVVTEAPVGDPGLRGAGAACTGI